MDRSRYMSLRHCTVLPSSREKAFGTDATPWLFSVLWLCMVGIDYLVPSCGNYKVGAYRYMQKYVYTCVYICDRLQEKGHSCKTYICARRLRVLVLNNIAATEVCN